MVNVNTFTFNVFRSLLMDGTEMDHILFSETSEISCITKPDCLENEVCVKNDKSDVGICECAIGFKRNIAGNYTIEYFL